MNTIDYGRLANDLRSDYMGAYFGGGFGAALVEAGDVDYMTPDQLIAAARAQGLNIEDYII